MKITITGASLETRIDDLVALARCSDRVEIGLLYAKNESDNTRYPSYRWLIEAMKALPGRCAVHICGTEARDELLKGLLDDLVIHAPRIQVNGFVTPNEFKLLIRQVRVLVTEHNAQNFPLAFIPCTNHELLVDSTGRMGKLPIRWLRPKTTKVVGFAGGLGPHNLQEQLPEIQKAAGGAQSWIELDEGIRENGRFSIEMARFALHEFIENSTPNADILERDCRSLQPAA